MLKTLLKIACVGVLVVLVIGVVWMVLKPSSETRRAPANLLSSSTSNPSGVSSRPEGVQTSKPSISAAHQGRDTSGSSHANWAKGFRNSADYFDFVARAAQAGLAGDGRAAYYVGEVVAKCALVVHDYKANPDAETQMIDSLAANTRLPQWIRDKQVREFRRCTRIAKEDPFDGLPEKAGGYLDSKFWYKQALDDADALAEIQETSRSLAQADNPNAQKDEVKDVITKAEYYLSDAVSSQDPDALFAVGMTLTSPRYSADPMRGFAVAIAACELGHDCSAANPENSFSVCKESGLCTPDADFSYYLQQTLSPDAYAKVYAQAQVFKSLLSSNDAGQLAAFTKIDGAMAGGAGS